MKKIKEFWLKIIKWFKYWFFYRPLIRKLLRSKGLEEKRKLDHFTHIIYKSVLLNKRMMGVEKTNLLKMMESMNSNLKMMELMNSNFQNHELSQKDKTIIEKNFKEDKTSLDINESENER